MASVRAPSAERIREIAEGFGIALTDADAQSFAGIMAGPLASYQRVGRAHHAGPAGTLSAHLRLATGAGGEPLERLVLALRGEGRGGRAAGGAQCGDQGQHRGCRRADDEWLARTGGLRTLGRRNRRHPHPRCRRDDRRQGRLRGPLLFRRQPHLCHRADPAIRTIRRTRPAARRAAVRPWWRPAPSTWRSAAIRAARSARRRAGAGSTA